MRQARTIALFRPLVVVRCRIFPYRFTEKSRAVRAALDPATRSNRAN